MHYYEPVKSLLFGKIWEPISKEIAVPELRKISICTFFRFERKQALRSRIWQVRQGKRLRLHARSNRYKRRKVHTTAPTTGIADNGN